MEKMHKDSLYFAIPTSANWLMHYTSMQRPGPPAQNWTICTCDDFVGESCDPTGDEMRPPNISKLPPICIISPVCFDRKTVQTPGSERHAAIARDLGIETGLWGGVFVVDPAARTAIHHHGEQETIAYVFEGKCYVRWGERGEFGATARKGDFIHVPAWRLISSTLASDGICSAAESK